ncbi:MAG: glutamine synthetase [Halieaceae bacterium]|jgi:glutamine synthetase
MQDTKAKQGVSAVEQISAELLAKGIDEVECLIPDMVGAPRGKFVPAAKYIADGEPKLPESILIQSITGEHVKQHFKMVDPTDCDMDLRADPNSVTSVPWASSPTVQIIHDCYLKSGEPHPLSSRNVLRRVLNCYKESGWQPVVAPEVEFYLVKKNIDANELLEPPRGRSGRAQASPQAYSIDAVSEFSEFVDTLYSYCEQQALDVDILVHESGAAQMEINFLHGDALHLADQVFMFKRTVREAALRCGFYATFMAKPMENNPGSAMHIHQSILDANTGANIFSDATHEHGHSERLLHYIGGLQEFTSKLISFYAPNINSYRRFAPEISAPINLCWGYDNRTTAFRIPASSVGAKRVENRFPGVDANPYLAFAATLASGYLGMKHHIDPGPPHEGVANEQDVGVARTLEEGLRALADSDELVGLLGPEFIEAYHAVKLSEFEAVNRVVTTWEREHLLLKV